MIFLEIYVCKSKLNNASLQIKESAKSIDRITSDLIKTTISLQEYWQGSDYETLKKKILNEYQENLREFSDRLKEYANYLENASIAYQKIEDIFQEKEIEMWKMNKFDYEQVEMKISEYRAIYNRMNEELTNLKNVLKTIQNG